METTIKSWVLGTLLLLTSITFGQACGVEGTYDRFPAPGEIAQYQNARSFGLNSIPVRVMRYGNISENDIVAQIEVMNEYYGNAGIHFFITEIVDIEGDYTNVYPEQEAELVQMYNEVNVINIYTVPNVYNSSGSSLCGYAYYPGGPNRIMMANSCFTNGSTLSHEMGHFFGLLHTHGSSNTTNSTDELADGSNGATAGDRIPDTPSDPKLSNSVVTTSCNYTGSYLDNNGQPHQPDPHNIMSYSRKSCRDVLTPGQYGVIMYNLKNTRNDLQQEDTYVCFDPLSELSNCDAPFTVLLENTSSDNTSNPRWDVDGDGIQDYTGDVVEHTYTEPGVYDVSLLVDLPNGDPIAYTQYEYVKIGGTQAETTAVHLELMTDNWPSEIDWVIVDQYGVEYASGGGYSQANDKNKLFEYTIPVDPDKCYQFLITDVYGDGICCTSGNGYYKLKDDDGNILAEGGDYGDEDFSYFKPIGETLTIGEIDGQRFQVYPNPFEDQLTISGELDSYVLYDLTGKVLAKGRNNIIDVSKLSTGLYILKVEHDGASETMKLIKN